MFPNNKIISKKTIRPISLPSKALRVSIINHCNLKCFYCHNEGQSTVKKHHMSVDDLLFIASESIKYGINNIRLTGGEPTLHPDLYEICSKVKSRFQSFTVGINTNGTILEPLLKIVDGNLVDRIVVGLDYKEKKYSKNSTVGIPTSIIQENILKLKKKFKNIDVSCVVHENISNLISLVDWCFAESIDIKLIEPTIIHGMKVEDSHNFNMIVDKIISTFDLKVEYDEVLKEYYGYKNGRIVKFFHSHCNIRECSVCLYFPLRITSKGYCRPCLLSDKEFPLLESSFNNNLFHAFNHLLKSIIINVEQQHELGLEKAAPLRSAAFSSRLC